jgi:hypothetical protein
MLIAANPLMFDDLGIFGFLLVLVFKCNRMKIFEVFIKCSSLVPVKEIHFKIIKKYAKLLRFILKS